MTKTAEQQPYPSSTDVTVWFDPVCPYSWNTARWLRDAATTVGFDIEWRLTNLAILNEGRELPPPQQARMNDSRRIGRLMAAVHRDKGSAGLGTAYFAFGQRYFDQSAAVDDDLADHVLTAVGGGETTRDALTDTSLDHLVRQSHDAGQSALGEQGGSPILSIDGHALFGPVLTALPAADTTVALFGAVATLAATTPFTQLQRPRPAA